jgi:hypothetical protein
MTGKQSDLHVETDKRRHSNLIKSDVRTDCGTDHYLVIVNVTERLSVSKQAAQKNDTEIFSSKSK